MNHVLVGKAYINRILRLAINRNISIVIFLFAKFLVNAFLFQNIIESAPAVNQSADEKYLNEAGRYS